MASIPQIFESMEYGPAPEAASPALAWIAQHEARFGHFIGGEWVQPGSGEWFESTNPATGKPIARVAQGSAADVDQAVQAACRALAYRAAAGGPRGGVRAPKRHKVRGSGPAPTVAAAPDRCPQPAGQRIGVPT